MQKLALHYNNLLKGSFELKKLNFLFVFQVNCPGCFLYGIPLVNELYKEFQKDISFLGLSTAFENFDLNTAVNTKLLVNNNTIIGHTKKALNDQGFDKYPYTIDFPIAMDKIMNNSEDLEKAILHICTINPNYTSFSYREQLLFKAHVKAYFEKLEIISMTFTLNQLKGTPSFILFDDNYEILYHKFGHIHSNELITHLNSFVKTLS